MFLKHHILQIYDHIGQKWGGKYTRKATRLFRRLCKTYWYLGGIGAMPETVRRHLFPHSKLLPMKMSLLRLPTRWQTSLVSFYGTEKRLIVQLTVRFKGFEEPVNVLFLIGCFFKRGKTNTFFLSSIVFHMNKSVYLSGDIGGTNVMLRQNYQTLWDCV